jgi:hypothetical protein
VAAAAWPRAAALRTSARRLNALRRVRLGRRPVALLACVVLGLTSAAAYGVVHATLLSGDEYNPAFQARIFANGLVRAVLPPEWVPFAGAITPIYVGYRADDHTWASRYLPGYAALKTPFEAAGIGPLLNPLLAGASVVFLALAARRLWPRDGAPAWLAVLLLAVSPQFLFTAATGYSMPAHLALNLAWLWLYLRGARPAWLALGPVGALALGLHNPFPHALFVTPFLLRTARERRWGRLAYLAATYGVSSGAWLVWLRTHSGDAEGGTSLAFPFALPNMFQLLTLAESVVMTATWQSPIAVLGVALALANWRALPDTVRDLSIGVALSFALQAFFIFDQERGWGYRYVHGVLGNVAIVGAAGLAIAARQTGPGVVARWTAVSLAISAAVQLPYRGVQIERETRPYADAYRFVTGLQADVVLVPIGAVWYGVDLIRNDPLFARRPVVAGVPRLSPDDLAALRARFGGRVREVRLDELRALGLLPPVRRSARSPDGGAAATLPIGPAAPEASVTNR